jgi:hypothetical protein
MENLAGLVLALTLASSPTIAEVAEDPAEPQPSAVEEKQDPAPPARKFLGLSPGDKVRFATADNRGTTVGNVVAADSDTLLLSLPGAETPVRLSWPSLRKLEVHRGRRSQAEKGAKIGALSLAIPVALLSVAVEGAKDIDCWSADCRSQSGLWLVALTGGAAGATVGILTGALIGSAFKTDRWDKVGLPPVHLSLIPQRRGGMAVALTLRF